MNKPCWEEFADAMEESQRLVEIERTADCTQRYLYELIHAKAFKEVREILRHTKEYMDETIEVLEEEKEQPRGLRASVHRQSA
jgi:type III secretory pathway component EscV